MRIRTGNVVRLSQIIHGMVHRNSFKFVSVGGDFSGDFLSFCSAFIWCLSNLSGPLSVFPLSDCQIASVGKPSLYLLASTHIWVTPCLYYSTVLTDGNVYWYFGCTAWKNGIADEMLCYQAHHIEHYLPSAMFNIPESVHLLNRVHDFFIF